MTIWYRTHRNSDPRYVFSGDGGIYVSGRWNYLGKKAIYCSESIALCTLEWLAHHGLSVSGFNYYRYSIDVPDELVTRFSQSELPSNWNATPSPDLTRDFAEKNLFLNSKALGMIVPSVIIPEELNLVINPAHKAFNEIAKSIKSLGQFVASNR